ncbi:MAG: adenylyl-sulfate kinase [Ruminococcaceae bacterium]|jgi:3'(2'), 5'-bisphosphate nucleotidase|nr:adenylyl-sulfate kinase [Oscillospiraceae bacterium]
MAENITPYLSRTSTADRMRITGSRPAVFWMTGLSGSGKSTVAALAEKKLTDAGHAALMIDGDTVRTGLCRGLGFSPEDRRENLRRIAELAKIAAMSGMTVFVCAISPTEADREQARAIISPDAAFFEVWMTADVKTCAARDPKGLYKKAFAGEIRDFTGVSAPYEPPRAPDIAFPASQSAESCADVLVRAALETDWDLRRLLCVMLDAAREASERIMEYYDGVYSVEYKEDKSPLTSADVTSNDCICAMLRNAFPEVELLSEEAQDTGRRLSDRAGVFIVDPLDGTKEFLSHNGEFCVSIGFAEGRKVRAGVIAVPDREVLYYAAEGIGAYKIPFDALTEDFSPGDGEKLHVSDRTDGLVVTVSRSHLDRDTEEFLALNRDKIAEVVTVGSCLKGCLIAEGRADLHWRRGAFMKEWDTAAMQIIAEEAGGRFTDSDGAPMPANREDPRNLNGMLIVNRPESLSSLVFPEKN